ncbi:MAG: hypothetical protein JWR85_2343 [Marmoricola sp.]|nr:hypothetical protein [Marmoricola sp.]
MYLVLRGLIVGVAVGVVFGSLARALMRLVAIGMAIEPEFHLGVSLAIVLLFVVSGIGAGVVGALYWRSWRLALVLLATSAPLLLMGAGFGIGEIREVLDQDLSGPWTAELLAMSGVIIFVALVTPYLGWRAGRRVGRASMRT